MLFPPVVVLGFSARDARIGGAFGSGLTVTKIDFVTPPAVAITLPPLEEVETGVVPMLKLRALLP